MTQAYHLYAINAYITRKLEVIGTNKDAALREVQKWAKDVH